MPSRLPPIPPSADIPPLMWVDEACRARGYPAPEIYRVLAHAPPVLERVIGLGYALTGNAPGVPQPELDRPLQELITMRVAYLTGCDYELGRHHPVALDVGVREEQLADLPAWEVSSTFDERERAALALTDEVIRSGQVPASLFECCRALFSPQELVEIAMTVSFYTLIVNFVKVFELEIEEDRRAYLEAWE